MKRIKCRLLPSFFRTVTVFNRAFAQGETVWYKTVIDGCFVSMRRGEAAGNGDLNPADIFTVRIPAHPACIPRREWEALTDKSAAFSLAPGDVCVLADVPENIPDNNSGSALLKKYDGFVIRSATENCAGPLAHWKIEGV